MNSTESPTLIFICLTMEETNPMILHCFMMSSNCDLVFIGLIERPLVVEITNCAFRCVHNCPEDSPDCFFTELSLTMMISRSLIHYPSVINHSPAPSCGTLSPKNVVQLSMDRDKLFFDPLEIVPSFSNMMFHFKR